MSHAATACRPQAANGFDGPNRSMHMFSRGAWQAHALCGDKLNTRGGRPVTLCTPMSTWRAARSPPRRRPLHGSNQRSRPGPRPAVQRPPALRIAPRRGSACAGPLGAASSGSCSPLPPAASSGRMTCAGSASACVYDAIAAASETLPCCVHMLSATAHTTPPRADTTTHETSGSQYTTLVNRLPHEL